MYLLYSNKIFIYSLKYIVYTSKITTFSNPTGASRLYGNSILENIYKKYVLETRISSLKME